MCPVVDSQWPCARRTAATAVMVEGDGEVLVPVEAACYRGFMMPSDAKGETQAVGTLRWRLRRSRLRRLVLRPVAPSLSMAACTVVGSHDVDKKPPPSARLELATVPRAQTRRRLGSPHQTKLSV